MDEATRVQIREELAAQLDVIGIDIKNPDARRECRARFDYLDRLFEMQDTNRQGLDFARELLGQKESLLGVIRWVTAKMAAEAVYRDAARKTLVDKLSGALGWVLLSGMGGAIAYLALTAKVHIP